MRTRILLVSALVFLLPLIAEAAGAPKTFKELANQTFTLLTSGIATLIALGIVIYLWSIASNIAKAQEGFSNAGYRTAILWGIIIIFVMVSVIGIVRLIGTTLFQNGGNAPAQQQVAPSSLLNSINYPRTGESNENV